jgi:dihydropteroate synthase
MGVLNVTPDSFSDGGKFFEAERAIERAMQMVEEGADFIDVGGESTRPGSEPVPPEEELRRTVPVVAELAKRVRVPISIDTYKSEVASAALDAGATMVNDISAGRFDPALLSLVAREKATIVLMHMKGRPKTMQSNPSYGDVTKEVRNFLKDRAEACRNEGIDQIVVDPGIGFGKQLHHNLTLLRELNVLHDLGYPVLVGPSRKSFIGMILDLPVEERLEGTAAAVAASILHGAHIVRVHDVRAMKRVAKVTDAIRRMAV